MEKAPPTKRPRYDAAFRAKALRLTSESRSTLAAARTLNIDPKRLYAWQKATQLPLPADPAEAAQVRAGHQTLRTELRRYGRKACQPKFFVPRTTDSTHGQRYAPNLLRCATSRARPRPTGYGSGDITGLPLVSDAWAYLCTFQNACTKHVVGRTR